MAVYRGDTRRQIFDLQVSTDNVTWTSVLTNAQSTIVPASPPPQEMFDFTDLTARWIRWVGHGHVTSTGTPGTWNSLTEVDFMIR